PRLDGDTAAAAARDMARLEARQVPVSEILAADREAQRVVLLQILPRRKWWNALGARSSSPQSTEELLTEARLTLTPRGDVLRTVLAYQDELIARSRLPWASRPPERQPPGDPASQLLLPGAGRDLLL